MAQINVWKTMIVVAAALSLTAFAGAAQASQVTFDLTADPEITGWDGEMSQGGFDLATTSYVGGSSSGLSGYSEGGTLILAEWGVAIDSGSGDSTPGTYGHQITANQGEAITFSLDSNGWFHSVVFDLVGASAVGEVYAGAFDGSGNLSSGDFLFEFDYDDVDPDGTSDYITEAFYFGDYTGDALSTFTVVPTGGQFTVNNVTATIPSPSALATGLPLLGLIIVSQVLRRRRMA